MKDVQVNTDVSAVIDVQEVPLKFHYESLGGNFQQLKDTFAGYALTLPYDVYDVANQFEDYIKKIAPEVYASHEVEWLELWGNLFRQLGDKDLNTQIAWFWWRRLPTEQRPQFFPILHPHRQRCFGAYELIGGEEPGQWRVQAKDTHVFVQYVDDRRSRERFLPGFAEHQKYDDDLCYFMALAAECVRVIHQKPFKRLDIAVHLMLTHGSAAGRLPAPEGIHQDGVDYIVSALVLERENVRGGESYIENREEYTKRQRYETLLKEGEGLFHSDRGSGIWHGVKPVKSIEPSEPAYRTILGFDIECIY